MSPGGRIPSQSKPEFIQNVLVMRHGDRIDHLEPLWANQAARPWDPPLAADGKIRAWTTGIRLRQNLIGFHIDRVVVSPFLRCLQTAAEVVAALCAISDDDSSLISLESSSGVPLNSAAVKVAVENGLCEVMASPAIRADDAPENGDWFPDISSEMRSLFPAGAVDHSTEQLHDQVLEFFICMERNSCYRLNLGLLNVLQPPNWGETLSEARGRYERVILALAEKYSDENLLLVTHGEAVGVSVSSFLAGFEVWEVEFCGYTHLRRKVSSKDSAFEVLTADGSNGIRVLPLDFS